MEFMEVTQSEIDKFLAQMQALRKNKPFTAFEEQVLIGSYMLSKRENIPLLESLMKGRQDAIANHQEGLRDPSKREFVRKSLRTNLRPYDSIIKLLKEEKK